jgi:glycosyltransferase involved in cell wall biosynthesis
MTSSHVKKICVLTSVHSAFDVRIFHKEAKTLHKAGYDVTLIAQNDKEEVFDGIRIVPLPKPRNRFERMTRTAWNAYWKALKIDADIYHLHDPELLPFARILALRGKRVIYDMHENVPKQIKNKGWINPFLRKYVAKLFSLAERIFLIDIHVIFAETSYHKDYLWIKKYTTILNMPLTNQLFSLKNDAQKTKDVSVGYIGAVSAERGSLVTIEALNILKRRGIEIQFECVGPIDKSHEEKLLKLCEKYNLHKITFHGHMFAYEGWHIIAQCDIGLAILQPIPNYIESYPTKLFEYMAMGLPVIASNFQLYKEIVEGNNCGICVDPLNPKEVAEAIEYLIDHPEEAKKLGENGRYAVLKKYNWEKEGKKLINLYEELLK